MADEKDTHVPPTSPAPAQSAAGAAPAVAPPAKAGQTIVVERRRGFFARWLGRLMALLLVVAILLLVAFVGITLVLRSDVPRSLAESVATEALGLELGLGGLDVGWDGDVTIENMVLRLPSLGQTEGEKLLEIPRLKAQLEPLPRIALNYLRGQQPQVKRLVVESPTAYATQQPDGQWNVLRALALAGGDGGDSSGASQGGGAMPALPEIELTDAKLIVRDKDGQEATLAGFGLTGRRDNALVYRIAGGSNEKLEIEGELFPASGRRQQVTFQLNGLNDDLRAIFGLPQATLLASWEGGLTDAGAEGILRIESASIDDMQLHGELKVLAEGGVTRITPVELTATNVPVAGSAMIPEGEILIGPGLRAEALLIDTMGGQVLVRSATFDPATLGGTLDVAFKDLQPQDKAHLSGELFAEAGFDAFGEPVARLALRSTGSMSDTTVENLDLEITADGSEYHDWGTLDVLVTVKDSPLLIRPPDAPTTLPEAEARILVRLNDPERPRIELARLRSLNPDIMDLRGEGVYFTAANAKHEAGDYLVQFMQRGYPVKLPRVDERVPLHLGVDLKGRYYRDPDPAKTVIAPIEITHIYGELAEVELDGFGQYVIVAEGERPEPPLTLSLSLVREAMIPAPVIPAAADIITARMGLDRPAENEKSAEPGELTEAQARQIEPIRGKIQSWLEVAGDPRNVQFSASGGMETSGFAIGAMELGTVRSDIRLTLTKDYLTVYTPKNEERTLLDWEYAQLFGAHLDFEAVIPFGDDPGHITLDVEGMDLSLAAEAVALPAGMTGLLDGHLSVDLSGLSPQQAIARGWFIVEDLKLPQSELAERITIGIPPREDDQDRRGGILLSEGAVNVPVEIVQFAQLAPGPTLLGEERAISGNVSFDLRSPKQLQLLNLKAQDYPLVLPPKESGGRFIDTQLSMSSPSIIVSFEEATPQVRGHLAAQAEVWVGNEPFNLPLLAAGELAVDATRDRVELEDLFVDLPDIGVVTGGGMLDLTDIAVRSRIYVHGEAINLEALAWRLDLPEGATGLADFSLAIQPGPGERPQGDVLVNFSFEAQEARWRSVDIEQGQVMVYLSRVPLPDDSPSRGQFDFTLVTTERVHLELANGALDGYFKLRNRGRAEQVENPGMFSPLAGFGDDWYVNATLDGTALSAGQLGALFDEKDVKGRVDFALLAYGNLNQEPRFGESEQDLPLFPLNGEGTLQVRRGELRDFNLFQRPIELINALTKTPQYDSVDAKFRLEQGHGYIDSLAAFVDGTEIRMSGRLYDVLDPGITQIEASGVVFAKPLAQIPLPFFREADEIFSVIQSNATAFRATGPLKDPRVDLASFSEIGETLRVLLIPAAKSR